MLRTGGGTPPAPPPAVHRAERQDRLAPMQPRMRVVYMGSAALGLPAFEALADAPDLEVCGTVTQPDRPRGRGRRLEPTPIKQAAERRGISPVLQPARVRDPESAAAVGELAPDLIVVIGFGQILPPSILGMPGMGCVNVHGSILPRHRGAAPIAAALLAGDAETGLTTMLMDAGLDTGAILDTVATPIREEDDAVTLASKLASLAPELLLRTLRGLRDGTVTPRPQDDRLATHAPKLTKEDGRIAWDVPAASVARRVRAMAGWPGAFLPGPADAGSLKILRARVAGLDPHGAEPGTVLRADAEALVVACGQGAVELLDLQPPGKRPMAAADYLRGRAIAPGTRFP